MIFAINALVFFIIFKKKNVVNAGYQWFADRIAPKAGRWLIDLTTCVFCLAGWTCIIEGLCLGWSVKEIAVQWCLTVIIFNLL